MTEKKDSLQALRAVAFILIFLTHAGSRLNWSHLGVSIFFCMSGFLLVYNGYDNDLSLSLKNNFLFAIKKIKKLYPLHIITMLLALLLPVSRLVIKGDAGQSISNILIALGLNLVLLQTWWPSMEINIALNGVAWFLSAMVFLYFCYPWIIYIIKKIKKEVILCLISILILVMQLIFSMLVINIHGSADGFWMWATYFFPVFRLGDFIIGCNLGVLYLRHLQNKKANVMFASVLEIAAVFAVILFERWRLGVTLDKTFIFSLTNSTTAYIVFAVIWILLFSLKQGYITRLLTNKIMISLGNISATAFLIHYVVILYVGNALNFFDIVLNTWQQSVCIIFEFIITILISVVYMKLNRKNV